LCCRLQLPPTFSGFAFGRDYEAQSFNLLQMFIRSTKFQICTSPRLTQNPSYVCKVLNLAIRKTTLLKEQRQNKIVKPFKLLACLTRLSLPPFLLYAVQFGKPFELVLGW